MISLKKPKTTNNDYLNWLERGIERRGYGRECSEFISDLHNIMFISVLPIDDNRALDGLMLRLEYLEEMNLDEHRAISDENKCSMLEMLVALAGRMDYILYEPVHGERIINWFWMFIKNLKLATYNCDDFEIRRKRIGNKIRINKFLRRNYHPDGTGGLFPLKYPFKDQTEVEIWYQMMYYLDENYSIS